MIRYNIIMIEVINLNFVHSLAYFYCSLVLKQEKGALVGFLSVLCSLENGNMLILRAFSIRLDRFES